MPVALTRGGIGPERGWLVAGVDVTGEDCIVAVADGGKGGGVTTAIGMVLEGCGSIGGG